MNSKPARIVLVLSVLVMNIAFSQDKIERPKTKKNAISLEFYQPVQNTIGEFYNDQWILSTYPTEKNNYSRKSFSNAFGISYERVQNDLVYRVRLGITIRDAKEHQDFESINTVQNFKAQITQDYSYKQNHINAFIGIAKRINVAKNFNLDLGVDLASVYYSKGKGTYYYDNYQENTVDNSLLYRQTAISNDKIGNMYAFGLGPVLKPQYTISQNWFVAAEFQVYFMTTFTNDTTRRHSVNYTTNSNNASVRTEVDGEVKYDVNQWNWTKISPLIRIGYEF